MEKVFWGKKGWIKHENKSVWGYDYVDGNAKGKGSSSAMTWPRDCLRFYLFSLGK